VGWERSRAIFQLKFVEMLEPVIRLASKEGRFVTILTPADYILSSSEALTVNGGGTFVNFANYLSENVIDEEEFLRVCASLQLFLNLLFPYGKVRSREVMEEFVLGQKEDRFAQFMKTNPFIAEMAIAYVYKEAIKGKSVDPATVSQLASEFGLTIKTLKVALDRLENR
jgi:hypothetical protein